MTYVPMDRYTHMTTSTPPAWKWLDECAVPVQVITHLTSETPSEMCRNYRDAELSIHSRKLPDSAALHEQNDSDQRANGEQCPPSALIPSDQCDECRAAPNMPHNPECERTAQLTDAQSDAVETHPAPSPCGDHVACPECINREDCDVSTSPDISCDRKHDNLDDGEPLIKVESCPEGSTWADIEYGDLNQVTESGLSNPLSAHMWETFIKCLGISRHKNADYANGSDPLANFRACQQFGVTLPQGIMVRLSDKFSRIGNLLDGRDPAVSGERLEDTIQDAINYLAILAYALEPEE